MRNFYTATLRGSMFSQQIINRFTYAGSIDDVPTNNTVAIDVMTLVGNIVVAILPMTNVAMSYQSVEVQGSDGVAMTSLAFAGYAGALDEDNPYPVWASYTFKGFRPSLQVRHAWKRFAGVSESVIADPSQAGVLGVAIGFLTNITNVVNALAATDSSNPSHGFVTPVVVHKHVNEDLLPRDQWIIQAVSAWSFNGIGSQRTRKA